MLSMTTEFRMPAGRGLPTAEADAPLLDELDRGIVAALQLDGRATWQQVARTVGASESTVSRRANRLLQQDIVRIVGVADPLRCGLGYPVLLQVECAVGAVGSVARTLALRPDVRFLTLLTGSHDLVLEIIVASRAHLATVLVDQLKSVPGITRTTTESVVRNFKTSYDWSRALLTHDSTPVEAPTTAAVSRSSQPMALGSVDMELLQWLAVDGRLSAAELAGRVRASEPVVRRRVDALTAGGALRFATLVDPRLIGYDCEFILWLDVDLRHLEEIAAALGALPEIRYISATAGYSDLVAEVILRDLDDLYRFNTEVLAALPGVRRSEIGIELQTVKRAHLTSAAFDPTAPHYIS
jgi:DNA-binding Lrp family transcriptional regulator